MEDFDSDIDVNMLISERQLKAAVILAIVLVALTALTLVEMFWLPESVDAFSATATYGAEQFWAQLTEVAKQTPAP